MSSQIPDSELDRVHSAIMQLKGYLPSEAGRYLEKEVIGYLSPVAIHSYCLQYLRDYADVLRKLGENPPEVSEEIIKKLDRESVSFYKADEYESLIGHDIRGLVRACQDVLSDKTKSFVYPGLTSYDLFSTAYSLALRDFAKELMIPQTITFARNMIERMKKHAGTVMIARTHLQHATATTAGHWIGEILNGLFPALENYKEAVDDLRGKASGFVGTNAARTLLFDTDSDKIDELFFKRIGLKRDDMTSQPVHHYFYQNYFNQLVGIAAAFAKYANDLRKYQQTEVGEILEQILPDQVSSSTGAHKKNPITSEQVSGMRWRQLVAQNFAAMFDYLTDFQRDLRDSANKRVYVYNMGNIAYGMAKKAAKLAKNMTIRDKRMLKNIGITKGLVVAEPLQNILQRYIGLNSDRIEFIDAHEHVQSISREVVEKGGNFIDEIQKDALIRECLDSLPDDKRELILKPEKYIGTSVRDVKRKANEWEKHLEQLEKGLYTAD